MSSFLLWLGVFVSLVLPRFLEAFNLAFSLQFVLLIGVISFVAGLVLLLAKK